MWNYSRGSSNFPKSGFMYALSNSQMAHMCVDFLVYSDMNNQKVSFVYFVMQIHFSRNQSTCTVNLHDTERVWTPLIFVRNGSCMRGYDVHPPSAKWLGMQGFQEELAAPVLRRLPGVILRRLLGVSATGYLYIMIEEIKSCQPEVSCKQNYCYFQCWSWWTDIGIFFWLNQSNLTSHHVGYIILWLFWIKFVTSCFLADHL